VQKTTHGRLIGCIGADFQMDAGKGTDLPPRGNPQKSAAGQSRALLGFSANSGIFPDAISAFELIKITIDQ
jgi:hypothetical protein